MRNVTTFSDPSKSSGKSAYSPLHKLLVLSNLTLNDSLSESFGYTKKTRIFLTYFVWTIKIFFNAIVPLITKLFSPKEITASFV